MITWWAQVSANFLASFFLRNGVFQINCCDKNLEHVWILHICWLSLVVTITSSLLLLLLQLLYNFYIKENVAQHLKLVLMEMQQVNDRLSERIFHDELLIQLAPIIGETIENIRMEREEFVRDLVHMIDSDWKLVLEGKSINILQPSKKMLGSICAIPLSSRMQQIMNITSDQQIQQDFKTPDIAPNYGLEAFGPIAPMANTKKELMADTNDPNYQTLAILPDVFKEPSKRAIPKKGTRRMADNMTSKESSIEEEMRIQGETAKTADEGKYENLD